MNECSSEAAAHDALHLVNQEFRTALSAITGVTLALSDRLEGDDAAAAHLIASSCERLVQKIDCCFSDLAVREQPEGRERAIKPQGTTPL